MYIHCSCEGFMSNEVSKMGCILPYPGFDLSDPEKEKVGILAIQLKERSVVHSVSFVFQYKLIFTVFKENMGLFLLECFTLYLF